jgi:ATP-dependent Zn protease
MIFDAQSAMPNGADLANCDRAHEMLQSLAIGAIGASGADIERIVREARQNARRERRSLHFSDLRQLIERLKPEVPADVLWQRAVHEAAHVVARLKFGFGKIELVTINGPGGQSYVASTEQPFEIQTELDLTNFLVVLLAGRAAEVAITGVAFLGSGGAPESDLGRATKIAIDLETQFGTGVDYPLVYRPVGKFQDDDLDLRKAVNMRLERAWEAAVSFVQIERESILIFAKALAEKLTLARNDILSLGRLTIRDGDG